MNSSQKITYSLIQNQFVGFEISEAHGLLIALICGGKSDAYEQWINEIRLISDSAEYELNEELLKILYEKAIQELSSKDFSLQLMIPDEEDFLARIDGFLNWCQGFLYGFAVSGLTIEALDEDGKEFIQHLSTFTMLDRDLLANEDQGVSEELALEELVEFVRMSALMIYYQFNGKEGKAG